MKISFFGHFGTLNTGNESTLQTILSHLRSRYPECAFCCVCSNPESAAATVGIEAVPISTRVIKIWNREERPDRRVRMAFVGVGAELRQYQRAFSVLKGTDMLIFPGTGMLTDAYGLSAWGPYNIFKWTLIGKLRGCKVLFVSVGAGPLYSAFGRFFVKAALSMADYRSFRDASSLNYLKDIGFNIRASRTYPDLVFSFPEALIPLSGDRLRNRTVVGLGLMEYAGKYSIAHPKREIYTSYLESLVVFVKWLLVHNYDVRLLFGDADGDIAVIQEFKSLLRAQLGTYDEDRIIYDPITSVEEVLSQVAATDIMVATRFHNVLLALLLKKPVIAISFHHKCTSLMDQMGLSRYCSDITQMNADVIIRHFEDLTSDSDNVRNIIARRVAACRVALDEQYDLIFKGL